MVGRHRSLMPHDQQPGRIMFNQKKIDSGIVFGNGQRLKAECIGDKRGLVVQKDGSKAPILMRNVKYVPQLYCNLFSITAALRSEEHTSELQSPS